MAGLDTKAFGFALTGNGAANGTITVASTANVWVGAQAWIHGDTAASKLVEVVDVVDATHLTLKLLPQPGASLVGYGPNYGTSTMAAYTTVDNARIDFPQQNRLLKHNES